MLEHLLEAKITVPPAREPLVARPALLARLDAGAQHGLTLVSAPAGFGKTTLVSDWLHRRACSPSTSSGACWLALEPSDNSETRFLAYLVAALRRAAPTVGHGTLAMNAAAQPPPLELRLGALLNDLTALARPLTLVLDDYHVVTATAVHDALRFLVDHRPPALHLVILTREDPPLALPRLRARQQLNEVRLRDLRFSIPEAALFLRDVARLELADDAVQTLTEQTEGWIAGLQLAAISLRETKQVDRFVSTLVASNRYILDFLMEEVFSCQPPEVQEFLLRTAILDRFNADLCAAVTGRDDCPRLLRRLEQANLFLIPLSGEGDWRRYHHLFAELLRQRLRQSGQDVAALHRRAGDWLRGEDRPVEAIDHYLSAGAWEPALDLLQSLSDRMFRHGDAPTFLRWAEQIPDAARRGRPALMLQVAWALILTGNLDRADALLEHLKPLATSGTLLADSLVAQAHIARARFDNLRTIALSRQALALLPAADSDRRAVLAVNLGIAFWNTGRLADANRALLQAQQAAVQSRNHYAHLMALGFLALVRGAGGTLDDAARLVRQALDHAGDQPVAALAHRVLGALLYEWDDLPAAETHLEQARGMAGMIGNADLEVGILRQLAQLRQAQAQPVAALSLLNEVHELAARRQMPPFAHAVNAACHTAIALAQRDLDSAQFWAGQVSEAADVSPFYPRLNLTPARLLLAQGQNARAAAELAERYAAAQAAGWQWGALEAQALQALAATHQEEALAHTRSCLAAAQREGFVRLFLDKGPRMLGYCALLENDPEVGAYARVLLARAATPVRQTAVAPLPGPLPADPLSERELELLALLARRRTNAEIARALFVSVNTVKTHLRHIYQKLDVHDRHEAVAVARALQILD